MLKNKEAPEYRWRLLIFLKFLSYITWIAWFVTVFRTTPSPFEYYFGKFLLRSKAQRPLFDSLSQVQPF